MIWKKIAPQKGDIVRVKAGSIYHFGICSGENEIIQFGLNPSLRGDVSDADVEICITNFNVFCNGEELEVGQLEEAEAYKRKLPSVTVEQARARLGEKGYNILHNNCEHFAYECYMGERHCEQEELVREKFRNIRQMLGK